MHLTLALKAFVLVLSHYPGTSGKNRLEMIFEINLKRGRAQFFSQKNTTSAPYSPENIAFASCNIVLDIANYWVDYHAMSIVFGALPLTFWLATRKFKVVISDLSDSTENGVSGKALLEEYNALKTLTRSINSIWAALILSVVMNLSICIVLIHWTLTTGNIIWSVSFGANTLFLIVGMLMMADGCRLVI